MGGTERVAAQMARAHEQLNKAVRAGIIDQAEMNARLGEARGRFTDAAKQAGGLRTELRLLTELAAGQAVASAVPGIGGFALGRALGGRGLAIGGATIGAVAGGAAGLQLAQAGDQLRILQAQLRAFTGGSQEADRAFAGLLATSRATGTSFQDNAVLLRRLTQAQKDLGASTDEVIQFQETVQKLMVASGSATSEASAGTLQLAQALASGRVQGDEFRSIMENMTEVARAAAQGLYEMGVLTEPTIGALNELREAGALTAKDFFEAILTQGPRANQLFAQMPDTIGRAAASVGNEFLLLSGHLAETTGATDALIGSLRLIAGVLRTVDEALEASRGFFDRWGVGVETNITIWQRLAELIPGVQALMREPIELPSAAGIDEISGLFTAVQSLRQLPELKPLAAIEIGEEQVRLAKEAAQETERLRKEAESLAETRREGAASLRAEAADLQRLLAAHAKGEKAFTAEKLAVEGLQAARRVGLDLSTKEGRAYTTLAANVADLTLRLRDEEEQRRRLNDQRMAAFEQMNEEEMRRRVGQATAGGMSAPGDPDELRKELSEPFKNALEDIQGAFTDTFDDLAHGAIMSFEDAANQINDIFIRLSANVSSLAIAAQFDPRARAQFNSMAQSVGMTPGQLTALSFAPAAIGTTVGLFGNRGAQQGMNIGGGVGGLAGAGIGFAMGGPAGAMVGGMIGQTAGMGLGAVFGGLFGDDNRGRDTGAGGPLGGITGTGQAAQFARTVDSRLLQLLNARQEELVAAALRTAPTTRVKFQEEPSPGDLSRLAAGRIGPAAAALGFNVGGVAAAGATPEEQFANLQRAVELFQQIQDFRLGPVNAQFAQLRRTFDQMWEDAARLGIAGDAIIEMHNREAQALERRLQAERVAVSATVGATDPLTAALQALRVQMDDAWRSAVDLGVSTANIARTHDLAAQAIVQQNRLQQIQIMLTVGATTDLGAAMATLDANMRLAWIEAQKLGIATAEISRAHSLAAMALVQQDRLQRHQVMETVGSMDPLSRALADLDANMRLAWIEAERLGISTANIANEHNRLAQALVRSHQAQLDAMALSIVDPFDQLSEPLREFQKELDFALLNPLNQAQQAADDFRRLANLAVAGSTEAMQQLEQAGQFYIEQAGRFGASPAQVAATQEVRSVLTDTLDQIERARAEAARGFESAIERASQRQVDKLDELVTEVRVVADEIRRTRRF